jgi:hypothetical protein
MDHQQVTQERRAISSPEPEYRLVWTGRVNIQEVLAAFVQYMAQRVAQERVTQKQ